MRDGARLRANVYRPDGDGPWPVLLARTPYGKDVPVAVEWLDPVQAARRGFLMVIQDTRGRCASEGEWDPFRFEREDGYDTVEWAAKLPGSNGRVGMWGASYAGNSQWLAAIGQPPSLAAISPAVTWSDPLDGLFARGGALELGLVVPWTLQQGFDYLRRTYRDLDLDRRTAALVDDWDALDARGYLDLPVHDMAVLRRHGVPDLGSIRSLEDPEIASRCRVAGAHSRVQVPSLHIAGWYDIFLQGTLDNYTAMAALGQDSRLLVGPWSHSSFADPVGEQVFGVRASKAGPAVHPHGDINDFQLAWLGSHVDPHRHALASTAPVRIFVMGRNAWREENEWPPARTTYERWFLHADGGLSTEAASGDGDSSSFVFDPTDPVPTLGGNTVLWPGYRAGPMDQARVEARADVMLFTSPVLEDELEVTGRVRLVLRAATSAPSTDWVARLCDVHPDGRSFNVCDGIVRSAAPPHVPSTHEIDLWSTSTVFLRGHRLRVHVTSSSFPRWDRNLNTGDQRAHHHAVAQQRIFHGPPNPTYIDLPVVR